MKTRLLFFLFLGTILSYGQGPTDYVKRYDFTNGSLINLANPGTYDIILQNASSANATQVNDRNGNPNSALDINFYNMNSGNFPSASQEYTYSFWVNFTQNTSTFREIVRQLTNNNSGSSNGLIIAQINGGISAGIKVGSESVSIATNNSLVSDGEWHNVVVTVSEENTATQYRYNVAIYVDGSYIQDVSSTYVNNGTGTPLFGSGTPQALITNSAGGSNYQGEFDDLRVWNRALTPQDVNAISTPTDEIIRHTFTNGSLVNEANPGTGDLVQSGTSAANIQGIECLIDSGIKINNDSYEGTAVPTSASTTEFSYSFWFRLTGNPTGEQEIIRFTNQDGNRIYFTQETFSNGTVDFKWRTENSFGSGTGRIGNESGLDDGNWHHIVMTSTLNTNTELRVYLDGYFSPNLTFNGSNDPFVVANTNYTSHATSISRQASTGFTNDIDNVRVYDRPITPSEIIGLYNEIDTTPNPIDDIVRYTFENGSYLNFAGASSTLSEDFGTNTPTVVNGQCGESNSALQSVGGTRLIAPGISNAVEETSYSFFVNTTSTGNFSEIVHHFSNNNTSQFAGSTAVLDGNKITVVMRPFCGTGLCSQQSGYLNVVGSTVVNDGNWHHIAYTVAKITSGSDVQYEIKMYVDGVLENSGLTAIIPASSNPDYINTGNQIRLFSGSGDFYIGTLDDVRIFNRVLNDVEIAKMSNYCLPAGLSQVFVDANATGANTGGSWANAYNSLSQALLNQPGAEFWVADGTYTPGSSRTSKFVIGEDQKVYGGFNGTETSLSQRNPVVNITVLSGDINGNDTANITFSNTTRNENAYNVVTINGSNAMLDGFTITGGNANGSSANLREGAGIRLTGSAVSGVEITNCTISGNTGLRGGAAIFGQTTGNGNDFKFSRLLIKNNVAEFAPIFYNVQNSGDATFTFSNSVIVKNTCARANGSAASNAAGIWIRTQNSGTTNTTIVNTTIAANSSLNSPASSIMIVPTRTQSGSGTFNLQNSIVYDNKGDNNAEFTPVAILSGFSSQTLTFNNSISAVAFSGGSGSGNVIGDPLFENPTMDDFKIASNSPAVDAGDNSYVSSTTTIDFDGNQRIFNTTVDMGAYEFNSTLSTDSFELNGNEIKIYPNPARTTLNISTKKEIKNVEVYNLLGSKVLNTFSKSINVSALENGIYLIKITYTSNQKITKRFIKQ